MKTNSVFSLILIFLFSMVIFINCSATEKKMSQSQIIEKGKYLVNFGGCNDCHSPKIFTEMGPVPDTTRLLSGSPSNLVLPPIDTTEITPGKWYLSTSDLTAWVGPWGISYSANLTPHIPTGIGSWNDEIFIRAMRTGKHMGFGRPILPPMPWFALADLTNDDLISIFAYLKSLPPIDNAVPQPKSPKLIGKM